VLIRLTIFALLVQLGMVSVFSASLPAPTLAIVGVKIIDPRSGGVMPDATVLIDGAVVSAVGTRLAVPPGVRVVDGKGQFLIPGLWDMHTHLQAVGDASLPLYIANGVTGVRDMGSDLDFILPLREKTMSRSLLGPRIVAAGPILDDAPSGWPFRLRVRNAAEAREAVAFLVRRRVDFIKVHDRTPREAYLAIAEETARLGIPLAGHVPGRVTIAEAIEAHQRSIEHLANFRIFTECSGGREYRAAACRPLFERLATAGVWQTPTLAFMPVVMTIGTSAGDAERDHVAYASPGLKKLWADNQRESGVSPDRVTAFLALAETAGRVVADLQRAGVGVLAGCDGLVPGFCLADELEALVRGGLPPVAALQSATIGPARYLGLERSYGAIERGKAADLVLLDGNPLDDIGNIRRIRAVVRNGEFLPRSTLDGYLQKAKARFAAAGVSLPALHSSNVPHDSDAQASMILPLPLVRRGPKVDSPFGVGREVGKHRTYQKRRVVIHGGAKPDPSAQPDVKAAADRQRQSGIGMGVSVMDAAILREPCTGEQQHPSCEGICILHI
jgi:imidazolonepropionase-like amidohydrolase